MKQAIGQENNSLFGARNHEVSADNISINTKTAPRNNKQAIHSKPGRKIQRIIKNLIPRKGPKKSIESLKEVSTDEEDLIEKNVMVGDENHQKEPSNTSEVNTINKQSSSLQHMAHSVLFPKKINIPKLDDVHSNSLSLHNTKNKK